jgi:hypothetical protein
MRIRAEQIQEKWKPVFRPDLRLKQNSEHVSDFFANVLGGGVEAALSRRRRAVKRQQD